MEQSKRPDFEGLYRRCYRQYAELIKQLDDVLQKVDTDAEFTNADALATVRRIHDEHMAHG